MDTIVLPRRLPQLKPQGWAIAAVLCADSPMSVADVAAYMEGRGVYADHSKVRACLERGCDDGYLVEEHGRYRCVEERDVNV